MNTVIHSVNGQDYEIRTLEVNGGITVAIFHGKNKIWTCTQEDENPSSIDYLHLIEIAKDDLNRGVIK